MAEVFKCSHYSKCEHLFQVWALIPREQYLYVEHLIDRIYSWLLCELWYSHTIVKHGQMPVVSLSVFSPTALLSIRHTGQRQIFLSECTHKYTRVHSEIYCPLVKKCKQVSLFHTWSNPLRFQMTFTHHNSMTQSWRLELKQWISMHKENMNRKEIWTNGKIWTEKKVSNRKRQKKRDEEKERWVL